VTDIHITAVLLERIAELSYRCFGQVMSVSCLPPNNLIQYHILTRQFEWFGGGGVLKKYDIVGKIFDKINL
jgi:hypothetical protein